MCNAPASLRLKIAPDEPADVVLIVDCIYHPSLLPALVSTIDYLTIAGRTTVIVVVELRAEDVIREFLQCWLDKTAEGEWELARRERKGAVREVQALLNRLDGGWRARAKN